MQQATLLAPSSPSVSLVNSCPATTSLKVAKFFGKRHDAVLRDIRNLVDNCPKEFAAHNFVETPYTEGQNGQSYTMFILFRDGFMLLVMGYTGKKAMQIKIAYIEAFNAMGKKLTERKALPEIPAAVQPLMAPEPDLKPYCTAAEMKPLDAAVDRWVAKTGKSRLTLLKKLRVHFGISRYHRFWPVQLIQPAIEWIRGEMGEKPKVLALPKAEQKALPCTMPPSTDAQTYEAGNRLSRAISDLSRDFDVVKNMVHILGRPGARLAHLSPEKDALYSNAMDAISMALCGLNMAQFGLRTATRIKVTTDFVTR